MITIGIDPGTSESGVVTFDDGKLVNSAVLSNADTLRFVQQHRFNVLAVEWIQAMGMSVGKEVFETCMWVGRFVQAATCDEVRLVPRLKIKLHHCGNSRAKDGNIVQSMKDKHGDKGTKKEPGFFFGVSSHAWQACAVAFYVIEGASHEAEIRIQKPSADSLFLPHA